MRIDLELDGCVLAQWYRHGMHFSLVECLDLISCHTDTLLKLHHDVIFTCN